MRKQILNTRTASASSGSEQDEITVYSNTKSLHTTTDLFQIGNFAEIYAKLNEVLENYLREPALRIPSSHCF